MCNIDTVDYIEMLTSEELSSIGRYTLLKPVTFEMSYDMDNSLWCLHNYDLALDGYGSTYKEAIECLEEDIEGHVLFFTRYPDSRHTNDSLIVKKNLKEFIDFKQVLDYLRERDGEV
jgi:hypothetical protein